MTASPMTVRHEQVFSTMLGSEPDQHLGRLWRGDREDSCLRGCRDLLRKVGLRPTRQRMVLARLLFSAGNRHVTAEMLFDEVVKAKIPLSLATVYNTLHQFTDAGLLRQIGVDGSKFFFDTNPNEHHHFFVQGEDILLDVPSAEELIDQLPQAPDGYEIARVDVVVRLHRKQA
ncbi:Fur family transcriptional regulator Irr [Pseudolabrys sp. FHR47]|uniref:Fur family transcriptional regulator Irr n=1 Tax=Pseudolabrys sp. FHR47 TaxID=2562284 RepID=UPI001FED34EF|nr:Fur family transcriptional regulator [Pseudolabrys sp. FHR47]